MRTIRVMLATVFVAWPILGLVKLLGAARKPVGWLAGLISERLAYHVDAMTMKFGIMLFFWSVQAVHGKERAQMAVLMLLLDTLHGCANEHP